MQDTHVGNAPYSTECTLCECSCGECETGVALSAVETFWSALSAGNRQAQACWNQCAGYNALMATQVAAALYDSLRGN